MSQRETYLFIADISGYTEFMLSTKTALEHGQAVIIQLLKSVITKFELPIKIAKFEGDAILCYLDENRATNFFQKLNPFKKKIYEDHVIADKFPTFIEEFNKTRDELNKKAACPCGACQNILKLQLKIFCHKGNILVYKIANSIEISGVDVIVIHRLLKNSIQEKEFILVTESAKELITLHGLDKFTWSEGVEQYPDIGEMKVWVAVPGKKAGFSVSN